MHLSIISAIDVKLLVLDELMLGLDILFRKEFYANLLSDYFDGERTIIITTHQVEEIENLLTDVMFINHGRIVLDTLVAAQEIDEAVMRDAEQVGRESRGRSVVLPCPDDFAPGLLEQVVRGMRILRQAQQVLVQAVIVVLIQRLERRDVAVLVTQHQGGILEALGHVVSIRDAICGAKRRCERYSRFVVSD